jgi:photosystem II stability/assembly factor-like uncharacterized protein
MKRFSRIFIPAVVFLCAFLFVQHNSEQQERRAQALRVNYETGEVPGADLRESELNLKNDWFFTQRSYPYDHIPPHAFEKMSSAMKLQYESKRPAKKSPLSTGNWTLIGPSNIGGRITSLVVHPTNPNIIYAGAATGGIWKSTDMGGTWANVFNGAFSIGSLAFDPTDPSIVYVGTGEANPSGVDTYPGNGVWRSTDDGATWTNIGLVDAGQIGKIILNPMDRNEIFVAVLGLYHEQGPDRGLYKSSDCGNSWNKVLYISDTTGATDVIMDPVDTNRVIAAMWTRYRTPHESIVSGTESGIFISTDGGNSWNKNTNGIPVDSNVGRIALTFAPSNPAIVYASMANNIYWRGMFRSNDTGATWQQTNTGTYGETQVWYNNVVAVDPQNPAMVWVGMTGFYQSTDSGKTFPYVNGNFHVDHHALEYAPSDSSIIIMGNDGGVFVSTDAGSSWTKSYNLPVTQYYAGTVDYQDCLYVLGGTQDNGSSFTHTSDNEPWPFLYGGDGFYCLVDPTDSLNVYAETEYGGLVRSTDGGNTFYDGTSGIGANDRVNWEAPIAEDFLHPVVLYTGTQYVYQSINGMQSWTAISGDLTYGDGGKVGTISTIDVSKLNSNVLYVGTDDGRVWCSQNRGATWQEIDSTLPQRWVTRVTADPDSVNVVYVTLSGFNIYDSVSHVYRSTNYGENWTNIGTTLPDVPFNDIKVDPQNPTHLFAATDLNVMYSTDLGAHWDVLGTGLPTITVQNLALHSAGRKLIAFTHGRSVFSYDLESSGGTSVVLAINPKWNLVSNPFLGDNDSANALFPSAVTNAYLYKPASGYQSTDSMTPGMGYWLKFSSATGQMATLSGTAISLDTISVVAGWNLIGSISYGVTASSISTVGVTLTTPFYEYNNGYLNADSILPGRSYWIKSSANGGLVLSSGRALPLDRAPHPGVASAELNTITITDGGGGAGRLYFASEQTSVNPAYYELPPVPPAGVFDARFASNRSLETVNGSGTGNFPILLSSAQYPLTIAWSKTASGVSATLLACGREIALAGSGSVRIDQATGVNSLVLRLNSGSALPTVYALSQNYPNPFNPSTVIAYSLPQDAKVTLKLYDLLGQPVKTLVDETQAAGYKSMRFDANSLPSGVYFYRLEAGTYKDVKKMVLAK